MERSGVFLLRGNDTLVAMEPGDFATEDDFQDLLSRFPELLVGDQIDAEEPRRWILVKREQAISAGAPDSPLWSIDHVFLDQDGIPTLVEIKRKSDSRLRREVVGQMMDYAANCISYWTAESLQSAFEATCKQSGQSPDLLLSQLLSDSDIGESYWGSVDQNLRSGTLRLLFVADHIPLELRRVVEFLNSQMGRTEVLAVELRQFVSQELRTIVPTVYGQSQTVASRKGSSVQRWTESKFFTKLGETVGQEEFELGKRIVDWMSADGRVTQFGTGKTDGSVYPLYKPRGVAINPVYLSSSGKLYVQFGGLVGKPGFEELDQRRALIKRLNEINGVNLTDADLTKYPSISLKMLLSSDDGEAKIFNVLNWIQTRIREAEQSKL